MKKHELFWGLGSLAMVFAYIAAVNIDVVTVSSSPGMYGGTYVSTSRSCDGLWDPTKWFDGCSSTLPPRLGTMALGATIFLVFGYFAKKYEIVTPKHDVWQRPDNGKYWCRNCSFTTDSTDLAIAHKRIPLTDAQASQVARPQAQQLPVSNAYGFGKSAAVHSPAAVTTAAPSGATATIPAPPTAAEFKACPDCAEEVRAAANKCRFCGYRFDASTNSDATASALGPGLKRS